MINNNNRKTLVEILAQHTGTSNKYVIENIENTAERLKVGAQFKNIPAEQVDTQLQNILRWCEYLQDSIEQEN